jgi:hypothetical protein
MLRQRRQPQQAGKGIFDPFDYDILRPSLLQVILSDPPYHLIARPGRELKNEDLKVTARLFMEVDKISTTAVRIIGFPYNEMFNKSTYTA